MEYFTCSDGLQILVHNEEHCDGNGCCIHSPSDHHMKEWPLVWDQENKQMQRVCQHGCCHPDPDDVAFRARRPDYVQSANGSKHWCDGCCQKDYPIRKQAKIVADAKDE